MIERRHHVCPKCKCELNKVVFELGIYYACESCKGRFVGVGLLRKLVAEKYLNAIWQGSTPKDNGRPCPDCKAPMEIAFYHLAEIRAELDVCKRCYMVWFDPGELESLPTNSTLRRKPKVSAQEEELVHDIAKNLAKEMGRSSNDSPFSVPDQPFWQLIPAFMGLPIKIDVPERKNRPWITWSILLLCLAVSASGKDINEARIEKFGFLASAPFRKLGVTWITSSFLHAGWLHVLGNMYFFLTFAPELEEFFGPAQFLAYYFLASCAGCLSILILTPRETLPTVGASGAVMGVLTYFALKYPRARVGFWFLYKRISMSYTTGSDTGWVKIPVLLYFVGLLFLQFLGAWTQVYHSSKISYVDHLGGIAFGAAWFFLEKMRSKTVAQGL